MKRFHQRKQLDLAQRQENFRNVTAEQMQGKRAKRSLNREEDKPLRITGSVAAGVLDPFDAFAADLSELPSLLAHRKYHTRLALPSMIDKRLEQSCTGSGLSIAGERG